MDESLKHTWTLQKYNHNIFGLNKTAIPGCIGTLEKKNKVQLIFHETPIINVWNFQALAHTFHQSWDETYWKVCQMNEQTMCNIHPYPSKLVA